LRVLIADDHPIVREGIKRLVQDKFDSALVHESTNGQDAIEAIRSQGWDIVILDINLPDINGLEVLKEAKVLRAMLPVIILSVYPEEQYAFRAFKAGADAYLTKESAPYELITAIETVRTGSKYVNPAVVSQLVGRIGSDQPILPHSLLSDREMEVLRMFANGNSLKEIGHTLGISDKTVGTYRARILMKLRLRSTVDLLRYALDQGIVQ
jgi:DNA-binding NarL/FixJ family response regulator